jgi:hypothetical protein
MTDTEQLAFILRVLRLIDRRECDEIYWWFDQHDELRFFVNCNDLFYWASADGEDVTPNNISELERAYADVKAIVGDTDEGQALFASRVRRMRPQNCCYPKHERLWPLFDACGPERADDKTKRPELCTLKP